MQHLRAVAQLLASDAPVIELLPRASEPIAALLDAQRVLVALRDANGDAIVFDSAIEGRPAANAAAPAGVAADVLARGETVARSGEGVVELGVPIRFGSRLLGTIVLEGVGADLMLSPLLESCALYLGARIHSEIALEATQRNAELAFIDALTGVANRRRFDETLETEWARARREGAPIALVMIDIDYFKAFNDGYGHQAGDLCLQQVARALAECAQRPTDLFARYGGEEFVALLPSTDLDGATAFAERLRTALARLNIAHGGSSLGHVSLSAGAAAARPRAGSRAAELIAAADAALYDAKIAGRNRVVTRGYASEAEGAELVTTTARTNLPLALTSLVGRTSEAAELRALLAEERLVTVVGAGGTGKTRLTLHVAAEQTAAFRDGVWLVDLAPVSDPALVTGTFAGAHGAGVPTGPAGLDALVRLLAPKHALIVVDNCEHVLAEAARVIAALMRGAPMLRVVATSREPLGIAGESRYRLPLLSLPPLDAGLRAADALASDAVALFAERARAVRRSFVVDDANAATVASIVRRLDGIALAIELAAARLEGAGLETLDARLDQRFRVLTGGDRGALPRQRTVRATFDWSYDLLTDAERTLFRRLAIFAGTFTLDAAAAACAGEGVSSAEMFDLLIALVRKSLVVDDAGGSDGFMLLESLRAYGREKLADAGETDGLARRHAAYYADLADQAGRLYAGTPTRDWLASAERHLTNYRAALEWSLGARNDVVLGARLAAALAISLGDNAADEGVRWLQAALDALPAGLHPSIEAQVWLRLSASVRALPANGLRAAAERAVALYRTLDERANLAHALRVLAQTLCWYFRRERDAADDYAREAIVVARASGDPLSLAYALKTRALTMDADDVTGKRDHLEEALTLFRRHGNEQQIGSALTWMSEMEFSAGEEVRALGYGRAALRYAETSGSRSRLEVSAANLAIYAGSAGDWATAVRAGTRALRVSAEARSTAGITWAIQALASVAAGLDDPRRAKPNNARISPPVACAFAWPPCSTRRASAASSRPGRSCPRTTRSPRRSTSSIWRQNFSSDRMHSTASLAAPILARVWQFHALSPDALDALSASATRETFPKGTPVMIEGDAGSDAFVVIDGRLEVAIGPTLKLPVAVLGAGDLFGEVAILAGTERRTASVVALTPATLLRIDGHSLGRAIEDNPHVRGQLEAAAERMAIARFIKSATLLGDLAPAALAQLAERVRTRAVAAGELVIRKGEPGEECFLVRSGEFDVIDGEGSAERRLARLRAGMLFGEAALLTGAPRNASVRAVGAGQLLVLHRDDVLAVMATDRGVSEHLLTLMQARSHPRKREGIERHERRTADGAPIVTLKDPARGTYFRLSREGAFVWERLDGEHTLRDLTMDLYRAYNELVPDVVMDIVRRLAAEEFVELARIDDQLVVKPTRRQRFARRMREVMEWSFTLRGCDTFFTRLYEGLGRGAFSRAGTIAAAAIAVGGFAAFLAMAQRSAGTLLHAATVARVGLALVPLAFIAIVLHEVGHGLAAKAAGARVDRVGLGWFWLRPILFVDTSDAWLATRPQRMLVDAGGILVNLVLAGAAGFVALLAANQTVAAVAWVFALWSYVAVLRNLNPLLEYDGYYLLMDALDRPNLRGRSLGWIATGLPAALRAGTSLRGHRFELLYALGAVAYIAALTAWTLFAFKFTAQGWVARVVPPEFAPLAGRVFAFTLGGMALFRLISDLLTERARLRAQARRDAHKG